MCQHAVHETRESAMVCIVACTMRGVVGLTLSRGALWAPASSSLIRLSRLPVSAATCRGALPTCSNMLLNNLHIAQSTYSQQQQRHTAGKRIALGMGLFFLLGPSNMTCLMPPCMSCSAKRGHCSWCIMLRYCSLSAFGSILLSSSVTQSDKSKAKSVTGLDARWLLRLLPCFSWGHHGHWHEPKTKHIWRIHTWRL